MTRVAVSTTSQLAADAAYEVASLGGNAVDCALAASLLTMNTEPGVCALAGGAYITVWKPGSDPLTIDGNVAVPGFGLTEKQSGRSVESVTMDYGGGITTLVGVGSVGVPGSLAAVDTAWRRYGQADWAHIFAPTIRATRDGFPLPAACHYYLGYSGRPIYGRSSDGFNALHMDGELRAAASTIVIPHLSDSLALIAEEGARAFYEGDLARAMLTHVQESGGMLTEEDLQRYEAIPRPSLRTRIGRWEIASNPPPAVGGAVLSAMLIAFANESFTAWGAESTGRLIDVQRACLNYRKENLDLAEDIMEAVANLLQSAADGQLAGPWASASTVHTSAVDDQGLACAITASSGYGSGEMPAGTGMWLNNCLGELELNRRGVDAGPVGARLPSNMAPSIARCEKHVLAVGSPGADRITTALHQFLVNVLQLGMPLQDAVAYPRIHVDTSGEHDKLATEPGLDLPPVELPLKTHPEINMYFGGVGAASFHTADGFDTAADPRRAGGVRIYHG